ncbi:uncharacterized protein METZ01_LOCUS134629, partial [marine metagenome]
REFAIRHSDAQISFVGTNRGLEDRIIGKAGFDIHLLRAEPLRGGSMLRKIRSTFALLPALSDAHCLLRKLKPDAVVGVGGYISGPLLLSAARQGIPTLILEPNYVPGLTNKWLARWVDAAAVAWEDTAQHFRGKAFVAGNPIRPEIATVPDLVLAGEGTPGSKKQFNLLSGAPLRVLLFGGSQGSRVLNDAMITALTHLPNESTDIVHQTGPSDLERVRAAYTESNFSARIEPYLLNMDTEYARCHVVVSRAGATTCAELAAAGRGAILVPLELAGGHQRHNAKALERQGAALLIEEGELDGLTLATTLMQLGDAPQRCIEMGRQARRQAKPKATAQIVDELDKLLRN